MDGQRQGGLGQFASGGGEDEFLEMVAAAGVMAVVAGAQFVLPGKDLHAVPRAGDREPTGVVRRLRATDLANAQTE
jgi:hypothetical protein